MTNSLEFLMIYEAYFIAEEPIKEMLGNLVKEAEEKGKEEVLAKDMGAAWLKNIEQRKKEAKEFADIFLALENVSYKRSLEAVREKAEALPPTPQSIGMLIGMFMDLSMTYMKDPEMHDVTKINLLCLNLYCFSTVINEMCDEYLKKS